MNNLLKFVANVVIPIIFVVCILFCLPLVCGHSHSDHGHSHDHHGHSHDEAPSFKWSREANEAYKEKKQFTHSTNTWFEAISATFLISIAPYLILYFIPISNTKEHEPYLKILLAFASGGLLGDAFLHLIPHALMATQSEEHSHGEKEEIAGHSHDNTVGVSVLAGIIVFLVIEKLVRIFKGGHGHSHSLSNDVNKNTVVNGTDDKKKGTKSTKEKKKNSKSKEAGSNMKVAGYLNLAADFTHNLTDGLAIGASFLAGRSVGIVTTLTIFLHEIPHEIGDFAILLQSGCSKKKAMMLQLITAFGAVAGTIISLSAEGAGGTAIVWILPFTAGGFIYIATVSVIPELLENSHFFQSLCEVTALLLGVGLMMIITWLEESEHQH